MAQFCIPPIKAAQLTKALSNGKFDEIINTSKVSSQQRREFFEGYIGKEMARRVNAALEKAIVSQRKEALPELVSKLLGAKKSSGRDIIQRIEKLSDEDMLNDNILEDYVSEILGAKITAKEAATIRELGGKVNTAAEKFQVHFDEAQKSGTFSKEYKSSLLEYAKALKSADEFMLKQTRADWSDTSWNHAKALMLLNIPTAVVNIVGNTVMSVISAAERRIGIGFKGMNDDLAKEWKDIMWDIRKETGYDMSRALSIDEMLEKKVIGEQMQYGRDTLLTKFVYNVLLGKNDAWNGRMAFADALNLHTAAYVKRLGLKGDEAKKKSNELFMDATRVRPQTEDGRFLRQKSVEEAQLATWTNDSKLAQTTLKIKAILNKFAEEDLGLKGFKVGDLIEPYVKTLANISSYGLDSAGIGAIRGIGKLGMLMKGKSKIPPEKVEPLFRDAVRDISRSGIGVAGALVAASFIPEENFVGAYDPSRHKYEQLRGSSYNAVRIGDKWYSLDWAGGFATPLIAVMYAKKYGGDGMLNTLASYLAGTLDQTSNIPFVGSVKDLATKAAMEFDPESENQAAEMFGTIKEWLSEEVTSRVPGFFVNTAKNFDEKEREANGFIENLQSKIPGWRNSLDPKLDMLGQELKTEVGTARESSDPLDLVAAFLTQNLAGARIKTAKDTVYGKEIIRLRESGNPASFTSWTYRLGKRQSALKEKLGEEKYREVFQKEYGDVMVREINNLVNSESYKSLSDKEKKAEIDQLDDDTISEIYDNYGIDLRD